MNRKKINITCLQKTKWVGEKGEVVEPYSHKFWYTGRNSTKNWVERIIHMDLLEDVIEIRMKENWIMLVKLVDGENVINIISVHASQIGIDEISKK